MNKKHVWLMMALCLIPLGALAAIALFKIPVTGVVWGLLVALCPLSHLAMIWLMPHMHDNPLPQAKMTQPHDHTAH